MIRIRTEKTDEQVEIRLLPALAESIAATATGDLTFIATEKGKALHEGELRQLVPRRVCGDRLAGTGARTAESGCRRAAREWRDGS